MKKEELLEQYEALGEESDFLTAKPLYEQELAETRDARVLNDYGYLLFAHAQHELRRAVELYERAIALDPDYDKPHYQLIAARAALQETELAVRMYEERLRNSPGEVREYRFLALAYLTARVFEQAQAVVEAGLDRVPDDSVLIAARGDAKSGLGDADGALSDWRRALELEPEDIGPLYSSAFLLEREGRLADAADVWRSIIAWNESRGHALQTVWPTQELERVQAAGGGSTTVPG